MKITTGKGKSPYITLLVLESHGPDAKDVTRVRCTTCKAEFAWPSDTTADHANCSPLYRDGTDPLD